MCSAAPILFCFVPHIQGGSQYTALHIRYFKINWPGSRKRHQWAWSVWGRLGLNYTAHCKNTGAIFTEYFVKVLNILRTQHICKIILILQLNTSHIVQITKMLSEQCELWTCTMSFSPMVHEVVHTRWAFLHCAHARLLHSFPRTGGQEQFPPGSRWKQGQGLFNPSSAHLC